MTEARSSIDHHRLAEQIRAWSAELGFQQLGISDIDLADHERHLQRWLQNGFHGDMDYMHRHGSKRSHPEQLVEGTCRVISVRMDYMPPDAEQAETVLGDPHKAYISRYALGRDYHKVMRKRLQELAGRIEHEVGEFGYRVFVDSAPVLEKAIAEKAGLGWIGKHSNLINKKNGSWFFLGEIYTDLPLPASDRPAGNHCGDCTACIDACPTDAIIAPYTVDARRCISYLTIELHGSIPVELRRAMGNRIYGCDDCQLCCPWNRFMTPTGETDFFTRHPLDAATLLELFGWDEAMFLSRTEGSAIRRIGYVRWLRNIAVALGNAPASAEIISALQARLGVSEMLDEHIHWAITAQREQQE